MLRTFLSLMILLLFFSCKENKEYNEIDTAVDDEVETGEMTEAEKIADAYGYKNWENVEEIDFAFNVARKEGNPSKRLWKWRPSTGDVTMMTANDTVTYNRNSLDSISMKVDQAFINDKYWFLTPYQLVWDEGTVISGPVKVKAPLDSVMMNKITITYGDVGGYTPGDAYDLYYGNDYKVKQWVYRRQNADSASMTTSWDNELTINGITYVKDYNNPTSGGKIFFTDVDIKMKEPKKPN